MKLFPAPRFVELRYVITLALNEEPWFDREQAKFDVGLGELVKNNNAVTSIHMFSSPYAVLEVKLHM